MKKISILLSLVLFCLGMNGQQSTNHQKDIFLFLGQSNMAGYGDMLPQDKEPQEGIVMLRDSIQPGEPYRWVPACHPVNNRLQSDRFSLDLPFAQAHRTMYPDVEIGLVPVAWGGAGIMRMSKGTKFYDEIIRKALWAKKSGQLKAILWHQGETDTVYPEDTNQYFARLKKLIQDLRTDLGMPDLPFIIGDLAEFYGTHPDHSAPDRVIRIRHLHNTLLTMQYRMPNVGFVPSTGLQSHDINNVHFNRASYIIFGHRYFDVYWQKFCKK